MTDAEITERMENAVQLATGKKAEPGFLDNITSASTKGEDSAETKKHEPTQNEKSIGNVLGISDKDRELYGPGGEKAANTGGEQTQTQQ